MNLKLYTNDIKKPENAIEYEKLYEQINKYIPKELIPENIKLSKVNR